MQINILGIYEIFFVLSTLLLLVYDMLKNERVMQEVKFVSVIVLSIFLFYVQGANALLFLPGVAIFYFMGRFYGRWDDLPIALLAMGYVLIASSYSSASLVAQVALLGLIASIDFGKINTKKSNRGDAARETRRDILQFFLGIILIVAFYLISLQNATILTLLLLILGYIVADCALMRKDNAISLFIQNMERRGTFLGEGAIMLGIGTLVAMSILGSSAQIMIVLSALFLGDPMATIIGINFGGTALPYNKNKSVFGTVACFVVVSLVAFVLVGALGIAFGAVAAAAESIHTPIDDNLFVAIILTFFLLIV